MPTTFELFAALPDEDVNWVLSVGVEQQVPAAGCRRVEDGLMEPRDLGAERRGHLRLERRREARLAALGRIDHVPGERDDRGRRQQRQKFRGGG